jgi:hypothetical protein
MRASADMEETSEKAGVSGSHTASARFVGRYTAGGRPPWGMRRRFKKQRWSATQSVYAASSVRPEPRLRPAIRTRRVTTIPAWSQWPTAPAPVLS